MVIVYDFREHANVLIIFVKGEAPMKKMQRPKHGRRASDISKLHKEQVEVTLKCSHCRQLVTVPCTEECAIAIP